MVNTTETTTENAVIVNGVVLTDEAVEAIKLLQEHNNCMINSFTESLADAVCFFSSRQFTFTDYEKKIVNPLIGSLCTIRETFKDLAKP